MLRACAGSHSWFERERRQAGRSPGAHRKAPEFTFTPGGDSANSTWFRLKFAKVRELDAKGKLVADHALRSLADHEKVKWSQSQREVGGVQATVTRMEVPLMLAFGSCLDRDLYAGPGFIAVETFAFEDRARVKYGNDQVEVPSGHMKFNVDSREWPFCGEDHSLEVNLEVMVKGGKPPKHFGKRGEGQPKAGARSAGRRGPHGMEFRASAGAMEMAMDMPMVALVDGVAANCSVEMDSMGDRSNIRFTFPRFSKTLLYDPTAGPVDPNAEAGAGTAGAAGTGNSEIGSVVDGASGLASTSLALAVLLTAWCSSDLRSLGIH